MKKLFFIFAFTCACFCLTKATVLDENNPIIMTEKIDNPIVGHGDPPKSPEATLLIYQDGSSFYFGESLASCAVTLLSNNVVVYYDVVGTDGIVTLPASFTGTFELCITFDSQVFSAEIEL